MPTTSAASLVLDVPATADNFDEAGYLAANPDVARNVDPRDPAKWQSGRQHFQTVGQAEGRPVRRLAELDSWRALKMATIKPLLRWWLPHKKRGLKYDFLTAEWRRKSGIEDTANISANRYDPSALALIDSCRDGVILDCGAGKRDRYFANVVNYEVVDYETTDVIGVGEGLPFKSRSFDGVLSVAVLEHVRDPFRCAAELVRVLKPGGRLVCAVPFLQPLHGYPHHYYNMTHEGLRALFDRQLVIDDQRVVDSMLPTWPLAWLIRGWAEGLSGDAREQFLEMKLRDFLVHPDRHLDHPWVRQLSTAKNFELAGATVLWAHKPR